MPASPSPAVQLRRQRIHEAVRALMAEQGFRISMDGVAARAGCSKQTLYAHFGSKQALMRSVVQERIDLATASLDEGQEDPRAVLSAFAMEHLQRLSESEVAATRQLLAAEAQQFPDEAKALYRQGMDALQQRLADWLQRAMRQRRLKQHDPRHAAELLLAMIMGLDSERQRFTVALREDQRERQQWVEFAVDAFLRAFSIESAAPRSAPLPRSSSKSRPGVAP